SLCHALRQLGFSRFLYPSQWLLDTLDFVDLWALLGISVATACRSLAHNYERRPERWMRLISFARVDHRQHRLAHGLRTPMLLSAEPFFTAPAISCTFVSE